MPPRVLHVDDDPGDRQLLREALDDAGVRVELAQVESGDRALARLREPPLPHLVLLDLNMRGLHGREVLRAIRQQASLAAVRVVILTTADSDAERAACAALGSDGYLVKPSAYEELIALARHIDASWLAPHRG